MVADKREELEEQLLLVTELEKRAELLCSLVELLHRNEPDQALDYARKALECAEQSGNKHWIGMGHQRLAAVYTGMNNYTDALTHAQYAQALFRDMDNPTMIQRCNLYIAISYERLGQSSEVLDLLSECLQYFQDTNDLFWEGYTLRVTGAIYRDKSDYIKALHCVFAAIEICRKIDDQLGLAMCYQNLASIYHEQNDFDQAHKAADQYLQLVRSLGDKRGEVFALNQLGKYLSRYKRFEEALSYIAEAEKLCEQYDFYRIYVYRNFASVYSQLKDWDKTIMYASKALQYYTENGEQLLKPLLHLQIGMAYCQKYEALQAKEYLIKVLDTVDILPLTAQYQCYLNLAYIFQDLSDYPESIHYYRESLALKDKITAEEKRRITSEMQTKFDVENTEREKEFFRIKNAELSAALEEVRQLNDRLTQLNQEKNEMLSIVAHDLKSPLSGIKMVSSLLKEHYDRVPKEELYHQLDTIEQTSDRMLTIATSLLKAQMLENEGLYQTAEQVEVVSLVSSVLERYSGVAQQKSIFPCLNTSVGEHLLFCNRDGLEQVIENLVDNAIKFTPHGKTIEVHIQAKSQSTIIEVCDEGPGISRKDRTRLFGKFARLSAQPTGGESSTGLGLWITKKTIEAMQGTIRYRSKPDGGARFCITIPHPST